MPVRVLPSVRVVDVNICNPHNNTTTPPHPRRLKHIIKSRNQPHQSCHTRDNNHKTYDTLVCLQRSRAPASTSAQVLPFTYAQRALVLTLIYLALLGARRLVHVNSISFVFFFVLLHNSRSQARALPRCRIGYTRWHEQFGIGGNKICFSSFFSIHLDKEWERRLFWCN